MIKKNLFILIFTLISSGCAERGSVVKVTPVTVNVISMQNKNIQKAEVPFAKLTLSTSREDKLQKNISGSLILIIGLLLIL